MAKARTYAQPRTFKKKVSLRDFFNTPKRKKIAVGALVLAAAIGVYLMFFVGAAPNNCQAENNVQICDVDMTLNSGDVLLSTNGEATVLANQGWGVYYGAVFRAPMQEYNGSVPIHRVINVGASWHDWVTETQKNDKQAKYGALTYEGTPFFAWTDARQPGTVPVYRLTRSGPYTQAVFSTDKAWVDSMIAQNANNPDGWKADAVMPLIAFYAYPPNYAVAATTNPYDCSILENYNSNRCDAQRKNVQAIAESGAYVGNDCPKNLNDWLNAPFKNRFDAECQKKWNDYSQRCDIAENFETDRCKGPRQALAEAQAAQAKKRAEEEAARRKVAKESGNGAKGGGSGDTGGTEGRGIRCPAGQILRGGECRTNPKPGATAPEPPQNPENPSNSTTSSPKSKTYNYGCFAQLENYKRYGFWQFLGWVKESYSLGTIHNVTQEVANERCVAKYNDWYAKNIRRIVSTGELCRYADRGLLARDGCYPFRNEKWVTKKL